MKRILVYTIMSMALGGLLLLPAISANAQEKGFHMGPPGDAQMEKQMAEGEKAAGISQEQREKMKALREEFRSKQKTLMDQVKAKREALRKELDSPNPNRATTEALAKEMNALQGQAALNRIDEVFKVRTIMTPEQYQKLREFHEKNREKMKEKMGDRKKDGKGGHGGGMWGGGKDVK
jgi:Spy/CpxP family protein refolding chaperone